MGPSSFLSIIATVTNGTMLNFNCGNNGHGLKNVTCKQTSKEVLDISSWKIQKYTMFQ